MDSGNLSPLDEIIPPLYSAFILTFPCRPEDRESAVKTLSKGWKAVLDEWSFLNSEIGFSTKRSLRRGLLKLSKMSSGSDGNVKVSDLTIPGSGWTQSYEQLKNASFPPHQMDAKILAPAVSGSLLVDQVVTPLINVIPGGLLIAFCWSHSFTDARGCFVILDHWARRCRVSRSEDTSAVPDQQHPSRRMEDLHLYNGRDLHHLCETELKGRSILWYLLGLHGTENLNPTSVSPFTLQKSFRHIPAAFPLPTSQEAMICVFSFTQDKIQDLKNSCSTNAGSWISSNDALVALLWRSIIRCRFPQSDGPESAESIVSVAVDGRSLLQPRLPDTYIGNAIFCCMSRLPVRDVVSPSVPLSHLASTVRSNILRAKDPSTLRDAVNLAAGIRDTSALQIAFKDFAGQDLLTTSWTNITFYDMDFGAVIGKPEYFRTPNGQFGHICCFLPRSRKGAVEVSLMLHRQ